MKAQVSLAMMLEEVEREIVARKRSYGARADEVGSTAWKMVDTMKALAFYLARQIEEGKTGEHQDIEWRPHNPGVFLGAHFEGPLLLSILSPIPSGGYRREVRYMDRKEDPRQIGNVYAIADLPTPAPAEVFNEANQEKTDVEKI